MAKAVISRVTVTAVLIMAAVSPVLAQRLPSVVVPNHYDLTFTPNFRDQDISGVETIDVRVRAKANQITLNALNITFVSASVTSEGVTQDARVILDPKNQMATLRVGEPVEAGTATIHITFECKLSKQPHGFYRAEASGRDYIATQFEPTYARAAFPCFDEPRYKATFSITLVVDRGHTAISNGPLVSDTPGPGATKHTLKFSRSPKMSSYLVAMTVGNYQCLKGSADGIPIRVCATPEEVGDGDFVLKASEHYLQYYDRYFSIKYPFGKLDLIAVPGFPRDSGMENTAAIFFGKSALLVEPRSEAGPGLGAPAQIIAHEIAHQWFGDLVTMKWWDDLWLNEGFATWMSFKAAAAWHPDWDLAINPASYAVSDGQSGALSVHRRAETPSEISKLFGLQAAYLKPAAVLRMLEAYEGANTFRSGVNDYLKKYAYANATGTDFWDTQAAVSKLPINRIMPTFIDQPGAPLVSLQAACQYGQENVTLSQQRYFSALAAFEKGSPELWQIPVTLKWPNGNGGFETRVVLLNSRRRSVRLPVCAPWIFGNAGANGYYVIAYTSQNLRAIARRIERNLTPAERAAIALDGAALLPIGKESVTDFMTLAQGLRGDPSADVIRPLLRTLGNIGQHLVNKSNRASYQAWIRSWLRPVAERLGWFPKPGEGTSDRDLRPSVLWTLGFIGRDSQTLAEARKLADKYLADPASVNPSLVPTILNVAALNGGQRLYDDFLAQARSVTADHRDLYWSALAHFTNAPLVQRTLDYAISTEAPRKYIFDALPTIMEDADSRTLVWRFVTTRWDAVEKIPFAAPFVIRQMGSFCDPGHAARIRQFFTTHPVPGGGEALSSTLTKIKACTSLRSQQGPKLTFWLKTHGVLANVWSKHHAALRTSSRPAEL